MMRLKTHSQSSPTRSWGLFVALGVASLAGSFGVAYATFEGQRTSPPAPAPHVLDFPPPLEESSPQWDEEHPGAGFYRADPDGQQIRAMFETGWAPIDAGEEEQVFVPIDLLLGSQPGEVLASYDADLTRTGYYLAPGVYISREVFEADDFDWRQSVGEAPGVPSELAAEWIAMIEARGGLSSPQGMGLASDG